MVVLNKRYFYFILLAAIAVLLPALYLGPGGADYLYHSVYFDGFVSGVRDGQLYPRWVSQINAGCGYPLFYFYPPLAYYLLTPFYYLFELFSIQQSSWFAMLAVSVFFTFIGGVYMYRFLKELVDKQSALVSTIIYIFIPYNIFVFYSFFTFAEFIVISLSPVMLFYLRESTKGDFGAGLWFSIIFSLAILSNIPGLIVISIILFSYSFFVVFKYRRESLCKVMSVLFCFVLIAIGISSFYWMPILENLPYVLSGENWELWQGKYSYKNSFLFWHDFRDRHGIMLHNISIITGIMFMFIVNFIWLGRKLKFERDVKHEIYFWLMMSIVAVFLMSPLSGAIWNIVKPLQVIQFPWRLSSMLSFSFIVVFATYVCSKGNLLIGWQNKLWFVGAVLICVICIFNSAISVRDVDFTVKDIDFYKENSQRKYYILKTKNIMLDKKIPYTREYMPKWSSASYNGLEDLLGMCKQKVGRVSGDAHLTNVDYKNASVKFDVESESGAMLEVQQFYYPSWNMKIDGRAKYQYNFAMSPSLKTGLININVPKGNYNIELYTKKTFVEKVSLLVSSVCFVIWLACWVLVVKNRRLNV